MIYQTKILFLESSFHFYNSLLFKLGTILILIKSLESSAQPAFILNVIIEYTREELVCGIP